MAKIVRFPLVMADGAEVRTLDELQKHFDLSSVVAYCKDGKLATWLEHRYLKSEAEAVRALDTTAPDFPENLCKVLDVEYDGEVDLEAIALRQERLKKLREFTDNDDIIQNIDRVAFNQDEVYDLLDEGAKMIWLCGESFTVPASQKGLTYIGVNHPKVRIDGKLPKNLDELAITLEGVDCDVAVKQKPTAARNETAPKLADAGFIEVSEQQADELSRLFGTALSPQYGMIETEHFIIISENSEHFRYEKLTGNIIRLKTDEVPCIKYPNNKYYSVGDVIYYAKQDGLYSFDLESLLPEENCIKFERIEDICGVGNIIFIAGRMSDCDDYRIFKFDPVDKKCTVVPGLNIGDGCDNLFAVNDGFYYIWSDLGEFGRYSDEIKRIGFYDLEEKKSREICSCSDYNSRIFYAKDDVFVIVSKDSGLITRLCADKSKNKLDISPEAGELRDYLALLDITGVPLGEYWKSAHHMDEGYPLSYHEKLLFMEKGGTIKSVDYDTGAAKELAHNAYEHHYLKGGLFSRSSSWDTPLSYWVLNHFLYYQPSDDVLQKIDITNPSEVQILKPYGYDEAEKIVKQMEELGLK